MRHVCADTVATFEDIAPSLNADSARMSNQPFESGGATFRANPALFGEAGPSKRTSWGPATNSTGLYYDFNVGGATPDRNDTAVVPGAGRNGSESWMVANAFDANSVIMEAPGGMFFDSLWLTNTRTVDFLVNNPDPNMFARPLDQPGDLYQVVFNDLTPGGSGGQIFVDLAGYDANAPNNVFSLSDWTQVDLSGFAGATRVGIGFAGTDSAGNGLNTPAYVAIDDVAFLTAVPEPSGLVALSLITGVVLMRRRRRSLAERR